MPWRLVLLWLCIALLPLRGWAAGAMAVPSAPAAHHAAYRAAEAAPCHGTATADPALQASAHTHAPIIPADTDASKLPATGTCALCDICHGAAAVPPGPGLDGFAPMNPGAPPAWTEGPTGRLAAHELFRPPRA